MNSEAQNRIPKILIVILIAVAVIAGSFLLDDPVTRLVQQTNDGHWNQQRAVELLSKYGDWPELMLLGIGGFLIAWRLRNVRWQRLLLSAMIASTLAGMTVNLTAHHWKDTSKGRSGAGMVWSQAW